MGKGRKPTSDHLKLVKGTLRKERINHDAPVADIDSPRPPAWLSRRGVESLALAAMRMAEIEECTALIEEHGRVMIEEGRPPRANPAVAQRNEAMRHLQSLLAEFGLTPSARSKITAPKKEKSENKFARASGS